MEGEKDELPIEQEGAAGSLSESDPAAAPLADPDLVLIRDAAEEFSLGSPLPDAPAVVDDDLVIDRTGFNAAGATPITPTVHPIRPPIAPPPKPVAPELPPPEPDLDAIYGKSEPKNTPGSKSGSFDWDAAFLAPVPAKKPASGMHPSLPPSGAPAAKPRRDATPSRTPPTRSQVERRVRRARVARASSPAVKRSGVAAILAALVFAAATALMVAHVDPFHGWYYLFAWGPLLLVLNWAAAVKNPTLSLFEGRVRDVLLLAAWSAPVWLFFEAWNLRVQNWYYIGVPDQLLLRWTGVLLSFATVLPGIFFFDEALGVRGAFETMRRTPLAVTDGLLRSLRIAGIAVAALILALPDFFFAFLWVVPTLLLEPWLFRRGHASLLQDLAQGRPGRILRLMTAGLGCGLFWETATFLPGGKWIYTVPFVGGLRVFEMPLLGFVGVAPFALACWSMARALVEVGVLREWIVSRKPLTAAAAAAAGAAGETEAAEDARENAERVARAVTAIESESGKEGRIDPGWRPIVFGAAALASAFVLTAMERWTIDSFTPRPEDVPAIPDGIAEYAHKKGRHDVRGLLEMINAGMLYMPGESSARVIQGVAERCRIVLLRGIGTANALHLYRAGVRTREDLAAREPDELVAALSALNEPGWQPKPRRVEIWIEAARRDLGMAGR